MLKESNLPDHRADRRVTNFELSNFEFEFDFDEMVKFGS